MIKVTREIVEDMMTLTKVIMPISVTVLKVEA